MGFVASKAAMRSVLVTSIGLTFTTASSAFAQETLTSLTSVSSITGDCKSELAGADLGCAGIASYASFKTGRELFNFPGTEVIAVAGPTAEQAKDGKATLRIDHVYISKTLVEADGQCSIQVPGGNNKTRIECGAVLRDGRKLAVSFSSDAKWKVSFGVPGDVAADDECPDVMKFHSFLKRAQSQCGYRYDDKSFQQKAKRCSNRLPEYAKPMLEFGKEIMPDYKLRDYGKDMTGSGNFMFDQYEKQPGWGAARVCAGLRKDLPGMLTLIGSSFSLAQSSQLIGLAFTPPSIAFQNDDFFNSFFFNLIVGGDCKQELAGTDLGCDGRLMYVVFKSGREAFYFPAFTVAGPALEPSKDGKATFWIDHVYIWNTYKNLVEADGQCSVQLPTGGSNKNRLECRAVLRDGRKLAASFSSDSEWKELPFSGHSSGDDLNCARIVRDHGFVARAQAQCGYRYAYFSDHLQQETRWCSRILQESAEQMTRQGMSKFDRDETERGHVVACADALKGNYGVLRK